MPLRIQTVSYTKSTRAHTQKELIRENPRGEHRVNAMLAPFRAALTHRRRRPRATRGTLRRVDPEPFVCHTPYTIRVNPIPVTPNPVSLTPQPLTLTP